jgi:hypothetical protein
LIKSPQKPYGKNVRSMIGYAVKTTVKDAKKRNIKRFLF